MTIMISTNIKSILQNPSAGVIRKMFEEGALLKEKFGADNVYDFSLGNPDLDPPAEVLDAIKEVAEDKSHNAHGYMSNSGYIETRKAMAEKTSLEQGVPVSYESIIMSVGAAGAINSVLKAIVNPEDEVIVPCPYFTEYDHYIHNHGAEICRVNTKDDFSLDIQAIKNALNKKTAAVIINSPNNPTGKIYSEDDIKALSEILHEAGKKNDRYP